MARLNAVACATASIPRRSGSSIATTWRARATANISIRLRRFNMHQRAVLAGGMRRTGACFCCLAMVALIFAAAPAKAGDNSIDVAVIVYDGVLTSDITAPLEVFGNAARKPWLLFGQNTYNSKGDCK